MKIIIAEDELLISEMLKEILIELGHEVIGQALNYEDALLSIDEHPEVNLIFCDINLSSDKTGVDLGKLVHSKYGHPIIYLSSYSDNNTLSAAAETFPVAYLIKPFSKTEINATLIMYQAAVKNSDKYVIIKDGHNQVKIWSKEIDYIKSDSNYITIKTQTKRIVVRNSLESFIECLNCRNIIRVHRSYAVNIQKVKAISGLTIILEGEKIPISRKFKEEVNTIYVNH